VLRLASRRVLFALGACLAIGTACARHEASRALALEVGRHHLRLVPPAGWEHLDHGRQQLFRLGEVEILLEDYGPATREGLSTELMECEQLWLDGRRRDALARMNTLHGPPILLMPQQARADFWKPWTDVTYIPDAADSAALGSAFDEMIRGARALLEVPFDRTVDFVLANYVVDARRSEIFRRDTLDINGATWIVLNTWDRTTHMHPERLACHDNHGYLLALATRRRDEAAGAAFDSLLASIEVEASP
jgi:hypothetical protein